MNIYTVRDGGFKSLSLIKRGHALVIATASDHKSLALFLTVVVAALFCGVYMSGYLADFMFIFYGVLALAVVFLGFLYVTAFSSQSVHIDREAGIFAIRSHFFHKTTSMFQCGIKDVRALAMKRTGEERESVAVEGDSVLGFISAKALGVGWITTSTTSYVVALYFLYIKTADGQEHAALFNYDRKRSDKAYKAIREFLAPSAVRRDG